MVLYNSVAWGIKNKIFSDKVTWLRGQAVKTSPFHGGNTGSIPVGVIAQAIGL